MLYLYKQCPAKRANVKTTGGIPMNWSIVMNVLFVVLIIAAIVLGVLYYFGRKLEKRQVEPGHIDAAKPGGNAYGH